MLCEVLPSLLTFSRIEPFVSVPIEVRNELHLALDRLRGSGWRLCRRTCWRLSQPKPGYFGDADQDQDSSPW